MNIIEFLLLFYIFLALSHFAIQLIFAELYNRKSRISATNLSHAKEVVIIYPIYNETAAVLDEVMQSARNAIKNLPNVKCIFVDDGSPNYKQLELIRNFHTRKYVLGQQTNIIDIRQPNAGKREAQATGIKAFPIADYYITVDSDTIINETAIRNAIAFLENNPEYGAATGDVRVQNANENLLTKLISLRYWMAFNIERAAQSYFGSMLCCSGPFTIYRGELLRKLLPKYTSQMFLGQKCTYGDDRHLTNLVLAEGYKTAYLSTAQVYTFVPTTIKEYITQQTRWNKSFYREFLWTLKIWNKISLYSLLDMILQPTLYFLFLLAVSHLFYRIATGGGWIVALNYVLILMFMAFLRSLYGIIRTGKLEFLKFILYGFIHILILVPVRFKALLTLNDNAWGTRGKKKNVWLDFTIYALFLILLISLAAVGINFLQ